MPSPVGHALGGVIVGLAAQRRLAPPYQIDRTLLAWCAIVACLPDIDFLWGRHSMETHSVGAAVVAGLLVLPFGRRLAIAGALAWMSHILFDWLGSDDFPPLGVMALWPFTSDFYFAHAYVFDTISRRYHLAGFWAHNLKAVIKEIILLAPVVGALAWRRWKSFEGSKVR